MLLINKALFLFVMAICSSNACMKGLNEKPQVQNKPLKQIESVDLEAGLKAPLSLDHETGSEASDLTS